MPGSKNKLWGIKYKEPYSKTCNKKMCTFLGCANIPYPCFGTRLKEYEIFIGFHYPEVSVSQRATIYACAGTATKVAYNVIARAADKCVSLNLACIAGIAKSIPAANKAGREAFYRCLVKSGLPREIVNKCEIGIYDKKHNA